MDLQFVQQDGADSVDYLYALIKNCRTEVAAEYFYLQQVCHGQKLLVILSNVNL